MPSHKILIVDDFEMIRRLIRDALADLEYSNVHEAEDGYEAQDMLLSADADNEPFEMVFCDWMMPVMSGYDLLLYCRNYTKFKTLPIVMVTAENNKNDVLDALKAGASEYIVKPISRDSLAEKIPKIFKRLLKPKQFD